MKCFKVNVDCIYCQGRWRVQCCSVLRDKNAMSIQERSKYFRSWDLSLLVAELNAIKKALLIMASDLKSDCANALGLTSKSYNRCNVYDGLVQTLDC